MKFDELQNLMYEALKMRNKIKKDTISAIITTAKNSAINAGVRDNIPEEMVDNAIKKELKTINEQLETCPQDRIAQIEEFKQKKSIVEELMPKQLSEDEIKAILNEKFSEVIATKNKGQIMKVVMPELKGKADGKLINQIISDYIK